MATITGVNNPGNGLHVDNNGRAQAFSTSASEQQVQAELGQAFNINTGEVTLTDAEETPLFYLENTSEDNPIKISRIFTTFLTSSGGAGLPTRLNVYPNITGGTILTATDLTPFNFNFGSKRQLGVVCKLGATGETFTFVEPARILSLFPNDNLRQLTEFDVIVLPKGSSMLVTYTPPTGNISQIVEAGCNVFVSATTRTTL